MLHRDIQNKQGVVQANVLVSVLGKAGNTTCYTH
jgi:hypothetical protein